MSDTQPRKIRIQHLREFKQAGRKIAMMTAYDAITADWAERAGLDVILVGDSLARSALGMTREIEIDLDAMIHHAAAVTRGSRRALRVGDLPFMTYKISPEQALAAGARMIREGGMEAVKIEGGRELAPTVERLTRAGLPVMGHIGLLPQSFHQQGGYRIQGRDPAEAIRLLDDAKSLEDAGAFCVVLECIPPALAAEISEILTIPTLGIGAGPGCDGQVLVLTDLLRMTAQPTPSLAKAYAGIMEQAVQALTQYADEVRQGVFPADEHTYSD
jgi:3-methyl-2-oxobutanoate hydroxymethyltransferase